MHKFMMLVPLLMSADIAVADDCQYIVDGQEKAMCHAVTKSNTSYCYDIRDRDTKSLCMALASGMSSYCDDIASSGTKDICKSKF